jgi:YegS/Rv2252/BmrU family lipid kinase
MAGRKPGRGAALIVNTQARSGQEQFTQAQDALREAGVAVARASALDQPERLSETIRDLVRQGCDPIIVGGGDGSLCTAAGVLARHGATLGVIPLGTANDFARTLGIPEDLAGACAVIAKGDTVRIDLGCMGDRYYLNLAAAGLAGEVTRVLPHWLKRVAGPLAYPLGTAYAFLHYQPFDARLTFPNRDYPPITLRRLLQVGVGNGHYYGGGMVVAPDASPEDGLLDVYAIEIRRWRKLLPIAAALKTGEYVHRDGVHYYRTGAVEIQTSRPLEFDVDGDCDSTSPHRFTVARAALRTLAPHARQPVPRQASTRRGTSTERSVSSHRGAR